MLILNLINQNYYLMRYAVLDSLVSTMNAHKDYRWEIGGYTDGVGSAEYNIKLSERRAKAVVDYLVSKGVRKHS